jgi:hypothetical protein
MKRVKLTWVLLLFVSIGIAPNATFAQSLSAGLGATNLGDGIQKFTDCQNQSIGHREKLTADRMDARLAKSEALTAEERNIWAADIKALRQVTPTQPFKAHLMRRIRSITFLD